MFGFLFGAAREQLELARVLNVYFTSFHRMFVEFGLERVVESIRNLQDVEVSVDSDFVTGFYVRTLDLTGFYFRLFKTADKGPTIYAMGSGLHAGFGASMRLKTGVVEVSCGQSPIGGPTTQAYGLARALKTRFGAVDAE